MEESTLQSLKLLPLIISQWFQLSSLNSTRPGIFDIDFLIWSWCATIFLKLRFHINKVHNGEPEILLNYFKQNFIIGVNYEIISVRISMNNCFIENCHDKSLINIRIPTFYFKQLLSISTFSKTYVWNSVWTVSVSGLCDIP